VGQGEAPGPCHAFGGGRGKALGCCGLEPDAAKERRLSALAGSPRLGPESKEGKEGAAAGCADALAESAEQNGVGKGAFSSGGGELVALVCQARQVLVRIGAYSGARGRCLRMLMRRGFAVQSNHAGRLDHRGRIFYAAT